MNILLIDVDSKIPNLALMKLSAYHKSIGDEVSINKMPAAINLFGDSYDKVYASVVFSKNKSLADDIKFYYPDSEIIIGGSGYDLTSKLKAEIEYQKPDYTLYPEIDYSLGYTTRGCNRACHFCIVPQKEGNFKKVQNPMIFYDKKFKKIVFLDNNILLDKEWFLEIISFCKKNQLSVDFNQGLDIRLADEEIIKEIAAINFFRGYRFAFDDSNLSEIILEKCELMKQYKMDLRQQVLFYVYVDSDKYYEDAVYRCRFLKDIGTTPFVQFNVNNEPSRRIKHLQRWANRRQIYWTCDINDYIKRKEK